MRKVFSNVNGYNNYCPKIYIIILVRAITPLHTPTHLSAVGVDEPLHIHTHSTRALVQDSKLRLMIEQPRHLRRRGGYS